MLKTVISVCLPDGTVQVTNPNVGLYSHVFAVQDEGVSAAVKCAVSTSGAQSNITGCSQVSLMYYNYYISNLARCKIFTAKSAQLICIYLLCKSAPVSDPV